MLCKTLDGEHVARFYIDVVFKEGISVTNKIALQELGRYLAKHDNKLSAYADYIDIFDRTNIPVSATDDTGDGGFRVGLRK